MEEFWPTLFSFLFFTVLFNFIEGCRCIAFVYAQLSCYSISSGWGLRFDSAIATPRFFFFQLLCCRFNALLSMSSCTTQFQPSFSWQSHGFTFYSMTAKFPSPVVAKIPQIIKPPPPCFTVGVSCLCWCAVFGFCLRCCSALLPNICSLFCPK